MPKVSTQRERDTLQIRSDSLVLHEQNTYPRQGCQVGCAIAILTTCGYARCCGHFDTMCYQKCILKMLYRVLCFFEQGKT